MKQIGRGATRNVGKMQTRKKIERSLKIGNYSLKDAEMLADSPFVDIFFGMQPTQQEIENSPLEELLTSVN